MTLLEILTMAVALGTDAFSVAVVIGVQCFKPKSILNISLIIAIFHIFMPLLGMYGGSFFEEIIFYFFNAETNIDGLLNLIGSGLLLLIGFYMLIEHWLDREEELANFKFNFWGILALASSVSIDSLSVGISLGMLSNVRFVVAPIFGAVAGLMMGSGLYFGSKVGHWLGEYAQVIGGLALIFLGIHFADFL